MQLQEADRAREAEAFGAGAAGVKEQRAAPLARVCLVAVAEDDDVGHALFDETLLGQAQLFHGRELVAHEKGSTLNDRPPLVRKAHSGGVVVTANGDDGRELFQPPD